MKQKELGDGVICDRVNKKLPVVALLNPCHPERSEVKTEHNRKSALSEAEGTPI